jgi:TolB-like protein
MAAMTESATAMEAIAASSAAMTFVTTNATALATIAASATAMEAIAASSAAMTFVTTTASMMTAMASSAVALNKIAKNDAARTSFAGSALLQSNAVRISATLTDAPDSLFLCKTGVNGSSLSSAYGTTLRLVGFNKSNAAYTANTGGPITALDAGALFVFVRTMGAGSSKIGSYYAQVYHLQTQAMVTQKSLSASYTEQTANCICVGGCALEGTHTSSSYYAAMMYDAWTAV